MKKAAIILGILFAFTACVKVDDPWANTDIEVPGQGEEEDDSGVDDGQISDDNNSEDTPESSVTVKTITVTWNGTSASVSTQKVLPVTISGADVTLGNSTSDVEGVTIVLKGSSTNGSFKFYNLQKTTVSLDGVSLTSTTGPAFNSQCKKHVYVELTKGSTNSLTDAATYRTTTGEDAKGCMFSEGQLVFSGTGSLTIKANGGHGIVSDDYIRIKEGTFDVTSAKDGLHANDYIRMDDGSLTIKATTDGIQVDEGHINIEGGTISITAGDDGIVTSYDGTDTSISPYITIPGGRITIQTSGADGKGIKSANLIAIGAKDTEGPTITIATAGATLSTKAGGGGWPGGGGGGWPGGGGGGETGSGESAKAVKARGTITIDSGHISITTAKSGAEGIESKSESEGAITVNGGEIYLKTYDDCFSTSGSVIINGGYIFAYATNNDAIDSNYGKSNSIVFNGGVTIAHAANSPEEGIDCDDDRRITVNGGTVFSSGGKQGGGSSSSPSHTQPLAMVSSLSLSTGYFVVTDSSGKVLMCCYVPRSISQSYSLITCPDFKSGTSYKCGMLTKEPTGYTSNWSNYYYYGGTASVSSKTITVN